MLSGKVVLHDIEDAEKFVGAALRKTMRQHRLAISPEEFEELLCEGLVILCDMASKFELRRAGHDADGRFSGYAAVYLPKKLGDAWHRLHPEHVLRTQADGTRKWDYLPPAGSLDSEMERAERSGGMKDAGIANTERLRVVGDFVSP